MLIERNLCSDNTSGITKLKKRGQLFPKQVFQRLTKWGIKVHKNSKHTGNTNSANASIASPATSKVSQNIAVNVYLGQHQFTVEKDSI